MPIFLHFMPAQRITLRVVLQHMENMQRVLLEEMRKGDQTVIRTLNQRMDRMDQRIDRIERKIHWMSIGIDNIDKRLDHIEIHDLPRIRSRLHMRRSRHNPEFRE